MRVRFLRDFHWRPPEKKGRVTIAFKKGSEHFVRKLCAADAIEAGAAVPATKEQDNGA